MNLTPGLLGLKPGVLGVSALRLRPLLQFRPLFRRTLRRSSLLLAPACSFPPPGPHSGKGPSAGREVAANASAPRRVNAVRVEEALVAPDTGLLLPQQWLQLEVLYQSSPDTALLDAPIQRYPEPQGGSAAAPGTLIAAPLNSIVPVPGRRPGRVPRSRAQAMPQLVEPEQLQLGEQQGEEQQQQQKPAVRRRRARKQQAADVAAGGQATAAAAAEAPAAPKRRGRPKKSGISSAAAPTVAVPVTPAGPALTVAPKRQRRQRKAASSAAAAASGEVISMGEAALELPAALEPAPAQPQRRRRRKAAAASTAAAAAATTTDPAAAAVLPLPVSEALEGHAEADGEALGLEGLLAVVQQLAAAAGLPSLGPSTATSSSSSSSSSQMVASSQEPAAPTPAIAAASAELATAAAPLSVPAQEAAAPAPAAAPGAAAMPASLVRSTRAAGSKPSLTRRSRLLRPPQQRRLSAASGVQQQHVAAEVQQSEGARDAGYLARMRESLQHGRRRKRSSSFSGPNASGSVTMFLSRLGDTPLLGKEHELRLARVLQKGSALLSVAAALRAQLGREPAPAEMAAEAGLPLEEAKLRLNNREEAKDLLLQYNLRLVVHIAKRYANQGVDLSDLIQEGEMGLRKAIERYDPDRGFRFSTFAHWYIRQPISRAVAEQGRDVRLPTHVCEVLAKIHRMEQALNKDPDRTEPATKEEIARALGMPLPRLLQLLRLARAPRLADRGGGDITATVMSASMKEVDLEEQWEDEEFGEMVEGINSHEHMKQNVSFILSTLPKRERNILRMRYGLLQQSDDEDMTATAAPSAASAEPAGQELQPYLHHQHPDAALEQATALATAPPASGNYGQELSLTEVSYAYGLSKERIRQIEDRALRALRNPWRLRLLHEINNGNRLSAGTLAHLAAAARSSPARRGSPGVSGMDSLHFN